MLVHQSDIVFRLSGGAANTLPASSLGGAKSTQPAPSALFDSVSGAEAAAGDVEYRCIYVHNASATDPLTNAVLWLAANTPSASTDIAVGLGASAMNGTEQTVADESAAPAGVTFSAAATKAAGIALGSVPVGQHRAVWVRRTVTAGAASAGSDGATFRVECESFT